MTFWSTFELNNTVISLAIWDRQTDICAYACGHIHTGESLPRKIDHKYEDQAHEQRISLCFNFLATDQILRNSWSHFPAYLINSESGRNVCLHFFHLFYRIYIFPRFVASLFLLIFFHRATVFQKRWPHAQLCHWNRSLYTKEVLTYEENSA